MLLGSDSDECCRLCFLHAWVSNRLVMCPMLQGCGLSAQHEPDDEEALPEEQGRDPDPEASEQEAEAELGEAGRWRHGNHRCRRAVGEGQDHGQHDGQDAFPLPAGPAEPRLKTLKYKPDKKLVQEFL